MYNDCYDCHGNRVAKHYCEQCVNEKLADKDRKIADLEAQLSEKDKLIGIALCHIQADRLKWHGEHVKIEEIRDKLEAKAREAE